MNSKARTLIYIAVIQLILTSTSFASCESEIDNYCLVYQKNNPTYQDFGDSCHVVFREKLSSLDLESAKLQYDAYKPDPKKDCNDKYCQLNQAESNVYKCQVISLGGSVEKNPIVPKNQSMPSNSQNNNSSSQNANQSEAKNDYNKKTENADSRKDVKHNPKLEANSCVSVIRKPNQAFGSQFRNICPYPIEVIWCSDSKANPNECHTLGYNRSANFDVGHSEPIDSTNETKFWEFSACQGFNSVYHTTQMAREMKHKCVKSN